jgi:hypothetical protein
VLAFTVANYVNLFERALVEGVKFGMELQMRLLVFMGYSYRRGTILIDAHMKIYWAAANLTIFNIVLLLDRAIDKNFNPFSTIRALYILGTKFLHGMDVSGSDLMALRVGYGLPVGVLLQPQRGRYGGEASKKRYLL